MGIIEALSRRDDVRLRVVVPRLLSDWARRRLARLEFVELLREDEIGDSTLPSEVVHRPYQIDRRADIRRLRRLGVRVVVGQLDLLAFRNPGYSPDPQSWEEYREAARSVLAVADRVHFSSAYALRDAIAEGIVDPRVCRVIPPGTDHFDVDTEIVPRAPEPLRGLTRELMLCLGSDYHHKNRLFALEVHRRLRTRHGWNGVLVLAGAHVPYGSSRAEEAEFLLRHPELEESVVVLAAVSESEKTWMLQRASGVFYPTVDEGFGLIPFEAAAAGVPCFFAITGALAEVLPPESASVVPWDADRTAERIAAVLDDPGARARLVETVRETSRQFRWDDVGEQLMHLYEEAADSPWRNDWRVEHVVEESVVTMLPAPDPELVVTVLGRQLVGVDSGVLDDDAQQALWALTRRRWLSRPLIGGITAVHRTGHRLQRALRRR
jgi:glycosyltransferase involved in cell wall biosynthesis